MRLCVSCACLVTDGVGAVCMSELHAAPVRLCVALFRDNSLRVHDKTATHGLLCAAEQFGSASRGL